MLNENNISLSYFHLEICCMCDNKIQNNNNNCNKLIPVKCLMRYGSKKSHKICSDCWWKPVTGFAVEGTKHECPGCKKIKA